MGYETVDYSQTTLVSAFLDAASLGRAAAVVGDRGYITDERDFQTCSLEGTDCSFSTCAGTADHDFDLTHPLVSCSASSALGGCLGSKGSSLFRTLEATRSS